MKNFISKYLHDKGKVLDVGSYNVNGSYKPLFEGWDYLGIDIIPGNNVDLVLKDPYHWNELESYTYDLVISGQCFEHIEYPWLTICEIARVLKANGLCYVTAPSTGAHHSERDCWRIFPDGFCALAKWANMEVLESYISWETIRNDEDAKWQDSVLICRKQK
jgi:SAM-dependent methyltransferase